MVGELIVTLAALLGLLGTLQAIKDAALALALHSLNCIL